MKKADVIIACTNASDYTLLPEYFSHKKQQWILDLSVPPNTHPEVQRLSKVTVAGVDEISSIMNETYKRREEEIPKAMEILESYRKAYFQWLALYIHAPLINDMKGKLKKLCKSEMFESAFNIQLPENEIGLRVKKTVGTLAENLRNKKEKGCQYIHAINDFFQPGESTS